MIDNRIMTVELLHFLLKHLSTAGSAKWRVFSTDIRHSTDPLHMRLRKFVYSLESI